MIVSSVSLVHRLSASSALLTFELAHKKSFLLQVSSKFKRWYARGEPGNAAKSNVL